jgi:hypothetical protein
MFKKLTLAVGAASLMLASAGSFAHSIRGNVYCDANVNGVIDANDTLLNNVRVVMSHPTEGEVSVLTGYNLARPGYYYSSMPSEVYTPYSQTLDASTLPADAVFVNPPLNGNTFQFSASSKRLVQDWLIESASCQPQVPVIEVCTEVTLNPDGSSNMSDADGISGDGCDVLTQGIPVGTVDNVDGTYRVRVTNIGSETLTNVTINAPELGLVSVPLPASCGDLSPGEECVITHDDASLLFGGLSNPGICEAPGMISRSATATGVGSVSGITVTDDDPAMIDCVAEPHISLVKEVSLDGVTFVDANTVDAAPVGRLGADASYRLRVINDGTEALHNIVVSDAALGIVDVAVSPSTLMPGDSVVLDSGSAGFSALQVDGRCDSAGVLLNVAQVNASGVSSDIAVSADDPAYVRCENPQIRLLKQVSLDGVQFFDADQSSDSDVPVGVVGHSQAYYRLIVSNVGSEVLESVLISDETLGIEAVVADLAVGETRTIDSGVTGFAALSRPGICANDGVVSNVARVDAIGLDSEVVVSDANPAYVNCVVGPAIDIRKQIRLSNGQFMDADTPDEGPVGLLGVNAAYRFIVRNVGGENLTNVVINDATLGLSNVAVGDLAVGAEVVINQSTPGFSALSVTNHCDAVGTKHNRASVSASGVISGVAVNDADPAYSTCEAPVACNLTVDQTCSVQAQASNDLLCTSAISATTLRYTGPSVQNATVVFKGASGGSATYNNVDLQQNVTVLTMASQNGYTVDAGVGNKLGAKSSIFINGKEEIIHTSCSAVYSAGKPAPLDANTPYPPNSVKGAPSPLWHVVNFRQNDNVVMVETPVQSEFADSCEVPNAGGMVTYGYKITNTGNTNVHLNSVLDSHYGERLSNPPQALAAGGVLQLTHGPVNVTQAMTNSVLVDADVDPANGASCSATDTVVITAKPAPAQTCADGKPKALGFKYVGGSCSDSNHQQGTKATCSGDSTDEEPVTITFKDKNGNVLLTRTVNLGESMLVQAGDKFESETHVVISDMANRVLQSLNIHTSCSAPLLVGDQHGGVILDAFIAGSDGGKGGKGGKGSKGKGGKGDKGGKGSKGSKGKKK